MIDWSKGLTATIYGCLVDPYSWRDMETFRLTDGQITRSDSTLIEAASLEADLETEKEQWVRVYLNARQEGDAEHHAIFTGLAYLPRRTISNRRQTGTLECFSVLKPAEDILLPRGFFVPAGADSGEAIRTLLGGTPAPVEVDETMPRLATTIIAEAGENELTMAMKIAQAVNRRIRITGGGTIQIVQKAAAPAQRFDTHSNDSIEPVLSMTHDWFNCPNVFRAICDERMELARDEDPESRLSIPARGREVWMEETSCNLSDGEGLATYAARRLKEEQAKGYNLSYTRRFHPDITISDLVGLHYPGQGIDGEFRVVSQRVTLKGSCRTEEEVEYC